MLAVESRRRRWRLRANKVLARSLCESVSERKKSSKTAALADEWAAEPGGGKGRSNLHAFVACLPPVPERVCTYFVQYFHTYLGRAETRGPEGQEAQDTVTPRRRCKSTTSKPCFGHDSTKRNRLGRAGASMAAGTGKKSKQKGEISRRSAAYFSKRPSNPSRSQGSFSHPSRPMAGWPVCLQCPPPKVLYVRDGTGHTAHTIQSGMYVQYRTYRIRTPRVIAQTAKALPSGVALQCAKNDHPRMFDGNQMDHLERVCANLKSWGARRPPPDALGRLLRCVFLCSVLTLGPASQQFAKLEPIGTTETLIDLVSLDGRITCRIGRPLCAEPEQKCQRDCNRPSRVWGVERRPVGNQQDEISVPMIAQTKTAPVQ